MYLDRPSYNLPENTMKHCYVCKIGGPMYPQSLLARWLPKRLNESSSRFNGKGRQENVSKPH